MSTAVVAEPIFVGGETGSKLLMESSHSPYPLLVFSTRYPEDFCMPLAQTFARQGASEALDQTCKNCSLVTTPFNAQPGFTLPVSVIQKGHALGAIACPNATPEGCLILNPKD